MIIENPFQILSNKLDRIEKLLLEIKEQSNLSDHITVDQDQKFSMDELASYLNVSKPTLQRYKNNGVFKFYQAGRTVYFKKSEIDAALASRNKI